MQSTSLNIFGVRHLSPNTAFRLLEYLEHKQPKHILIEGPSDATGMMLNLADKKVKPPVAVLAYTNTLPIKTVLYPFAEYAPEFQAILWAKKNKAAVQFIDLPTSVTLALQQEKANLSEEEAAAKSRYHQMHNQYYSALSTKDEEPTYEDYWEKNFESIDDFEGYRNVIIAQSAEMRSLVIDDEYEHARDEYAYNELREAYMRFRIQSLLGTGVSADKIVVIVGAYHVSGINLDLPALDKEAFAAIPNTDSKIALMPYSFLRLSSITGYGAGNRAPNYFQLIWQNLENNSFTEIAPTYITQVAQQLRALGFNASSASVIECIRLANALAHLKNHPYPILSDLHSAIITCLGEGSWSSVAEIVQRIDIGTEIGFIPEGLSQTPIQDDINRLLNKLKLANYKTAIAQDLDLDLRENLKVKSEEAAFLDLNRSVFLHRLKSVGVNLGTLYTNQQAKATWAEKWSIQWKPEVEIEIVETNLKGESLEIATAFVLNEKLKEATSLTQIAATIREAYLANLISIFQYGVAVLQEKLVDNNDFKELSFVVNDLSNLSQYGSIRKIDLEGLTPIIQQIFLRACLVLIDNSNCDKKAAAEMLTGINLMDKVSEEQSELVNTSLWQKELFALAKRDDLNSKLSGIAFAILMEHNLVDEDQCELEISSRLSPGVPADLGANWFEGFSNRNRYALLSRIFVWKAIDKYIASLDDEEFRKALVALRRAFSDFDAAQKNSIAELMSDIWGLDVATTANYLQEEFNESEQEKLDELSDFDFDF